MLITCSYAQAAALALTEAMQADDRVVALGEDIGRGGVFAQYAGLQAKFGPERVIDTPISEATMIGAGVGMALAGMRPVIEMRVVDFAICAMDEIVNQAAKNRYMFGVRVVCRCSCACPTAFGKVQPRSTRSLWKPGSFISQDWLC